MKVTLYDLELHLTALLDSEETVSPEQKREYANDLILTLKTAVEKRDAVAQYMAHLLAQADLAAGEYLRLKKRESHFRHAAAVLAEYVLNVIREIGADEKGKHKRLEGKTATFVPKKCPPSVEIADESQIPKKYFRYTLPPLSNEQWIWLVNNAPWFSHALSAEVSNAPSRIDIAEALKRGEKVPGARLVQDKLRLEIE